MKLFQLNPKLAGVTRNYDIDFEGIIAFIENQYKNHESTQLNAGQKDLWMKFPVNLAKEND